MAAAPVYCLTILPEKSSETVSRFRCILAQVCVIHFNDFVMEFACYVSLFRRTTMSCFY